MGSDIKHSPSTDGPSIDGAPSLSEKYQRLLIRYNLLIDTKRQLAIHLHNMVNSKGIERKVFTRILVRVFEDFLILFDKEINYFDVIITDETISCERIQLCLTKKEVVVDAEKFSLRLAEVKILQRLLLAQGSAVVFTDRKFIVEEMTMLKRKIPALKIYIKNANSGNVIKSYQIIF